MKIIKDLKDKIFPKYAPNPYLKDLPAHLKDPRNYKKIQMALLETFASKHSHSEMEHWSKCKDCMERVREHGLLMRKLGFPTGRHYLEWKRVMSEIFNTKRDSLKEQFGLK